MSKVQVLVHIAHFLKNPKKKFYFLKITNLYKRKEIKVEHSYYHGSEVINYIFKKRPLPVRIKPGDTFEIWFKYKKIPKDEDVFENFFVRTSDDKFHKSKYNVNVPNEGFISG